MNTADGLVPMPMSHLPLQPRRKERGRVESSDEEEAESMLNQTFAYQPHAICTNATQGFTIDEDHISPIDGLDNEVDLSPFADLAVKRSLTDRLRPVEQLDRGDYNGEAVGGRTSAKNPRQGNRMGRQWSYGRRGQGHGGFSSSPAGGKGKELDDPGGDYSSDGRPQMENVYAHIGEYMAIDTPRVFLPPPPPPDPVPPPLSPPRLPLPPVKRKIDAAAAAAAAAETMNTPASSAYPSRHDNQDKQVAPQFPHPGHWSAVNDTLPSLFSPMASCCGSSVPRRKKISALVPCSSSSFSADVSSPQTRLGVVKTRLSDDTASTMAAAAARGAQGATAIKRYETKKQQRRRCKWKAVAVLMFIAAILLTSVCAYLAVQRLISRDDESLLDRDKIHDTDILTTSLSNAKFSPDGPTSNSRNAVTSYQLGRNLYHAIPPYRHWHLQFYLSEEEHIRFFLGFGPEAVVGVYGRRGLPPTHTQYDFFHASYSRWKDVELQTKRRREDISHRSKRALNNQSEPRMTFSGVLVSGLWYISVYNDGVRFQNVSLYATVRDNDNDSCLYGCHGNGSYGDGRCVDGDCQCARGFFGAGCGQRRCPVPCGTRGVYGAGRCQCFSGWEGPKCDQPSAGCPDPLCGGNGLCVGDICSCSPGYIGVNCTEELCLVDCVNGRCIGERCRCHPGWTGLACHLLRCDRRCDLHGKCHNGTCVCDTGWNGKHCTLEGCGNLCGGHGTCLLDHQPQWHCNCSHGWMGSACDVAIETTCDDGIDDDRDKLIDCLDPDCCQSVSCRGKGLCQTVPNPLEILLRKQSPSSVASFFEHVVFLVEENSVQRSASISIFSQRKVSVVRGKVLSKDGIPVLGVKITIPTNPQYGFTLTREMGIFDILVNGGGSVTLTFLRPPFLTRNVTFLVQWNRMVILDPVTLLLEGQSDAVSDGDTCHDEPDRVDRYDLRPMVMTSSMEIPWTDQSDRCPLCSAIIPWSQVLQEGLVMPGLDFALVYRSSEVPGYQLTLTVGLTPDDIPPDLAVVRLRIYLEGRFFEEVFEADPNLRYRFAWDRRNAYNQKVYGTTEAKVWVGYQFHRCGKVVWKVESVVLEGCAITSSKIGDWSLSNHHTYNFQQGVLHKGDGTNIYLRDRPVLPSVVLGNGEARNLDCGNSCDGKTKEARLLAPVALVAAYDRSIYVGDYNLIRRISLDEEEVRTVLQLSMSEVPYKYHIAVSPLDGALYVSDYQRLQVLRVTNSEPPTSDLTKNYEVFAGTGHQCMPGDQNQCGDGRLATQAKLLYPKGIAIDKDGVVYVADGVSVRYINTHGKIETLIGSRAFPQNWKPLPCNGSIPAAEAMLSWPTVLAVNPLDNTLHILDRNLILKLTPDKRVVVVAGRPIHCLHADIHIEEVGSCATQLENPQHMSFASNGDMYVVEGGRLNNIRVFKTDGRILPFAGGELASCCCWQPGCDCAKVRVVPMLNLSLQIITGVTVTPDDIVHVADSGHLRVFSFVARLPQPDRSNLFEILDEASGEAYLFNRFGQHLTTRNVHTNQHVYNFTYSSNSYYSKVTRITDSNGNVTVIQQDYKLQAKEVLLSNGQRCKITVDYMGRLQTFTDTLNATTVFTYVGNTGLVKTKTVNGRQVYEYSYDGFGHVESVIMPTGDSFRVDGSGLDSWIILDSGFRNSGVDRRRSRTRVGG